MKNLIFVKKFFKQSKIPEKFLRKKKLVQNKNFRKKLFHSDRKKISKI